MKKLILLALCASAAALCQNPTAGTQTVYAGSATSGTAGASASYFLGIGSGAGSTVEGNRQWINPVSGQAQSFFLFTTGAQPSSGSLVCTVRINGADSAVSVTIPALGGAQEISDTTHTAAVAAGDKLTVNCANNATTASATIGGWGFVVK